MVGKVALEEAVLSPELLSEFNTSPRFATTEGDGTSRGPKLVDIHGNRLVLMDKHDVDYMILSLTAPGIQAIEDPHEAAESARSFNNYLADQVSGNKKRFGAFAALSMHDPKIAADELRRTVTEHGFLGALVNDTQYGPNNQIIFYDTQEWDPFWATCEELDVPLYLHPSMPNKVIFESLYKDRPAMLGGTMYFANQVGLHVGGMITKGVFDRHPKLKLIIGHLGEKIPIDMWRIDHFIEVLHKPQGTITEMKHNLAHYFKHNIWVTCAGNFDTDVLEFVCKRLGHDRVMFSIDSPYNTIEMACNWFDSITPTEQLTQDMLEDIASGTARRLFRLPE